MKSLIANKKKRVQCWKCKKLIPNPSELRCHGDYQFCSDDCFDEWLG